MTAVYVPITARRILRDQIGEPEDTGIRRRDDVVCRISLRVSEVTRSAENARMGFAVAAAVSAALNARFVATSPTKD